MKKRLSTIKLEPSEEDSNEEPEPDFEESNFENFQKKNFREKNYRRNSGSSSVYTPPFLSDSPEPIQKPKKLSKLSKLRRGGINRKKSKKK